MERKHVPASADVTFKWQVFEAAGSIMVLDGWGSLLGTFRTMGAAAIAMLATEAGPPPYQALENDNGAA